MPKLTFKKMNNTKVVTSWRMKDLTNLRTKLLRYIKHECDGNFVSCHNVNGCIRMKRSALKAGVDIEPQGKDVRVVKWLYVSSPEDLFKHGIDQRSPNHGPQAGSGPRDDFIRPATCFENHHCLISAISQFLGSETIEDYARRSLRRMPGIVPVLKETRHKGTGHKGAYMMA